MIGSKRKDKPKPNEPTKIPIIIPTIGNRYMYFAISSNVELDVGKMVKKENTEPICLNIKPPSNQIQNKNYWNYNCSKEKN